MTHSLASNILVYDFQTAEPKTTFPLKEFLFHTFKPCLIKFTGCFINLTTKLRQLNIISLRLVVRFMKHPVKQISNIQFT